MSGCQVTRESVNQTWLSLVLWISARKRRDVGYHSISISNSELQGGSFTMVYDQTLYINAHLFRYHTRVYFICPVLKSKSGAQSDQHLSRMHVWKEDRYPRINHRRQAKRILNTARLVSVTAANDGASELSQERLVQLSYSMVIRLNLNNWSHGSERNIQLTYMFRKYT